MVGLVIFAPNASRILDVSMGPVPLHGSAIATPTGVDCCAIKVTLIVKCEVALGRNDFVCLKSRKDLCRSIFIR